MHQETLTFLIKRGRALTLVKHHIAERLRVQGVNQCLVRELGCEEYWKDNLNGTLCGVRFPKGEIHPEFTKPDRHGRSRPKAGTPWSARFEKQKGYPDPAQAIRKAFNVPVLLEFGKSKRCTSGMSHIGPMLQPCGFLYISVDGPYALWTPDVPGAVAAERAAGHKVLEPAASWKPHIPGCKLIPKEEWDLLVAQHKLAQKRQELRKGAKR